MEIKKSGKELLTAFAESRLKEHEQELQTRYQGPALASQSEKAEAYQKHAKLFKSELIDKLVELKEKYNQEAGEMEVVVNKFVKRLG